MRRRGPILGVFAAIAAFLVVAALAWGLLVEPFRLKPVTLAIPCEGLEGPIRIAVFSDLAFEREGRKERELRKLVAAYRPDLVLVAGDLLNRTEELRDESILGASRAFLESLEAPYGRFLVPGEDESFEIARLRAGWEGVVDILVNESRQIVVRGDRLDLFGADILVHRVSWPLGVDAGRPYVFTRTFGKREQQRLVYAGAGSDGWTNVELTAAFKVVDPQTFVDFRLAWREGENEQAGTGWRITRHEYRDDFRAYIRSSLSRDLGGRVTSGFTPPEGVWCRVRIRVDDEGDRSRIRARFWREGDSEPEAWAIDATDEAPDRNRSGTIALGARLGERRYADLRVTDDAGRVLLEEEFRDVASVRRHWISGSALERWLLDEGSSEGVKLLLAHHPDVVIDVADVGGRRPALTIAGHTHGGQFRIPGIGALRTDTLIGRRYDRGAFEYRGVPLYVTPGVGTSIVPFRLFSPPEVTFLELTPAPPEVSVARRAARASTRLAPRRRTAIFSRAWRPDGPASPAARDRVPAFP